MTELLFIDTNIYLRFYDSNNAEYKKLLKTLPSLKDKLFITKQIKDEIERNKADVFRNSFDTYLKQAKIFNSISLPEHLDNNNSSEIVMWNQERKTIIEKLEISNKSLFNIYNNKINLISKSEDEISKTLNILFEKCIDCTKDEFQKAKHRKERGNPPGKSFDPLGDQINWEQLLNKIKTTNELYIISNDHDLLVTVANNSFLNPLLYEEIKQHNPKIKINCFHSLSNALLTLNKEGHEKIKNLPSEKILEEINLKEDKDFKTNVNTIYYDSYNSRSEERQRLKYLFKHALLSSDDYLNRLMNSGFSYTEAKSIIEEKA